MLAKIRAFLIRIAAFICRKQEYTVLIERGCAQRIAEAYLARLIEDSPGYPPNFWRVATLPDPNLFAVISRDKRCLLFADFPEFDLSVCGSPESVGVFVAGEPRNYLRKFADNLSESNPAESLTFWI